MGIVVLSRILTPSIVHGEKPFTVTVTEIFAVICIWNFVGKVAASPENIHKFHSDLKLLQV